MSAFTAYRKNYWTPVQFTVGKRTFCGGIGDGRRERRRFAKIFQCQRRTDSDVQCAMACVRECQTFLWGGTGTAVSDEQGAGCSCICEDEGWSDRNILGIPSCVPSKAHLVFGVVGLLASMTSLLHTSHHLYRQVGIVCCRASWLSIPRFALCAFTRMLYTAYGSTSIMS